MQSRTAGAETCKYQRAVMLGVKGGVVLTAKGMSVPIGTRAWAGAGGAEGLPGGCQAEGRGHRVAANDVHAILCLVSAWPRQRQPANNSDNCSAHISGETSVLSYLPLKS